VIAIPDRVNRSWLAQLDDASLVEAEASLHADFTRQDSVEKARRGTRYRLFEGPAVLIDAWLRWHTVNNEARKRGVTTLIQS
jgi:hypothetical protein